MFEFEVIMIIILFNISRTYTQQREDVIIIHDKVGRGGGVEKHGRLLSTKSPVLLILLVCVP